MSTAFWPLSAQETGYDLKKNVAGCDVLGVRVCWALVSRMGVLPGRTVNAFLGEAISVETEGSPAGIADRT